MVKRWTEGDLAKIETDEEMKSFLLSNSGWLLDKAIFGSTAGRVMQLLNQDEEIFEYVSKIYSSCWQHLTDPVKAMFPTPIRMVADFAHYYTHGSPFSNPILRRGFVRQVVFSRKTWNSLVEVKGKGLWYNTGTPIKISSKDAWDLLASDSRINDIRALEGKVCMLVGISSGLSGPRGLFIPEFYGEYVSGDNPDLRYKEASDRDQAILELLER